jgi:putative ABC transport system permease protein
MEQLLTESVSQPRFNTFLIGLFAVLALVLAIIGIYGVMSYDVSQRTGEIGIRVALGAQVGDIMSLMLRQGAALTLVGLALGILGALALTRFLKSLLFEVAPHDLSTFAFVSLVITVVAMVACYVPSRRATRVDPLVALRHE